jgi:hypothetical protein
MDHKQAFHILVRHVLAGEIELEGLEEAKMHVSSCSSCRSRFSILSAALTGQPSLFEEESVVALSCAACLDQLPEYVESELRGEDVLAHYPDMADHLQRCPDCRERHDLLVEILQREETEAKAPQYPGFDEMALLNRAVPQVSSQLDLSLVRRGRDYIAWLGEELERGVSVLMVKLVDVLAIPPARPGYAHRGVSHEGEELLAYFHVGTEELTDLESDISIYRDRDEPSLCRAVVEVSIPSQWPDFSGTKVVMTNGEEIRSAQTGRNGRVTLERIPVVDLERIAFTILPVGSTRTAPPQE